MVGSGATAKVAVAVITACDPGPDEVRWGRIQGPALWGEKLRACWDAIGYKWPSTFIGQMGAAIAA